MNEREQIIKDAMKSGAVITDMSLAHEAIIKNCYMFPTDGHLANFAKLQRARASQPAQEPVAWDSIEETVLNKMNKAFKLPRLHDDGLVIDDTQIGVEFALEKLKELFTTPPSEAARIAELEGKLAEVKKVIDSLDGSYERHSIRKDLQKAIADKGSL